MVYKRDIKMEGKTFWSHYYESALKEFRKSVEIDMNF